MKNYTIRTYGKDFSLAVRDTFRNQEATGRIHFVPDQGVPTTVDNVASFYLGGTGFVVPASLMTEGNVPATIEAQVSIADGPYFTVEVFRLEKPVVDVPAGPSFSLPDLNTPLDEVTFNTSGNPYSGGTYTTEITNDTGLYFVDSLSPYQVASIKRGGLYYFDVQYSINALDPADVGKDWQVQFKCGANGGMFANPPRQMENGGWHEFYTTFRLDEGDYVYPIININISTNTQVEMWLYTKPLMLF